MVTSSSRGRRIISTRKRAPPASPVTTAWADTAIPIATPPSPIPTASAAATTASYLTAEQMVFREGGALEQAGSVRLRVIHLCAQPAHQHHPYFAAVALGYLGLCPGRDNDLAAFAMYYGASAGTCPGKPTSWCWNGRTRCTDPVADRPAGHPVHHPSPAVSRAWATRSWWERSWPFSSDSGFHSPGRPTRVTRRPLNSCPGPPPGTHALLEEDDRQTAPKEEATPGRGTRRYRGRPRAGAYGTRRRATRHLGWARGR